MTNQSTKSLVYIAIGTAVIAALSQISLSIRNRKLFSFRLFGL